MTQIEDFKNKLLNLYSNYPLLEKVINENKGYIDFLYCHLNENIKLKIESKNKKMENTLLSKKIKNNDKFKLNMETIYHKYIDEDEKKIILKDEYFVFVYQDEYPEKGSEEYFYHKNRRDFLIPTFFHQNTFDFFSDLIVENIDEYKRMNNHFFKLLVKIRKYIKTIERLGVMLDSSITLSIHNLRKNKKLDLFVLHPKNDLDEIKEILFSKIYKELDFLDPYFDKIMDKRGSSLEKLNDKTKIMTDNEVENFHELVFDPNHHFYFFGIKIVLLEYDLKYRANRRYPKNIAELLITKNKLNKKVPKIVKLESSINVQDIMYSKDKFIQTVSNYLKKFNYNLNDVSNKIEELY